MRIKKILEAVNLNAAETMKLYEAIEIPDSLRYVWIQPMIYEYVCIIASNYNNINVIRV